MNRIGPDLFRLESGGMAAPHLIMGDVPMLVDAGSPGRGPALEDELLAAGVRVQRIILTHGDPDHVGGSDHLRAVTGAEVCANLPNNRSSTDPGGTRCHGSVGSSCDCSCAEPHHRPLTGGRRAASASPR